jgi:hypothetical protein
MFISNYAKSVIKMHTSSIIFQQPHVPYPKYMHCYEFVIITSQIYWLYKFIPNSWEICYFIGSYHLHMNVMHYLNMKVMFHV